MKAKELLWNDDFKELTEVRTDNKKRITLGKLIDQQVSSYRIYVNVNGQLLLDPLVTISAQEAWLYQNPERLASVKRGLQDVAEGKVVKRVSYAQSAQEDEWV